MGRVIRSEVAGFACELKSCSAFEVAAGHYPATSTWHDHLSQIEALADDGWSFILAPRMRVFCPAHADRAWACTCRRHPENKSSCTPHDKAAAALVWDTNSTPEIVLSWKELTA